MQNIKSNIWKIYCFRFFYSFSLIFPVLMPFYLIHELTTTQIFVLQSLYVVFMLFVEIPSGYLSDVIGRKKTLILASFLASMGIVTYSTTSTFYGFLLAELMLGFSDSLLSGTDSALIYDTLLQLKQKDKYKELEGKIRFYMRSGLSIACVLGVFLAGISLMLPFYINIIITIIPIFIVFSLVEPKRKKLEKQKSHFNKIIQIFLYCCKHSKIRSLMIFSSLVFTMTFLGTWSYYLYYDNLNLGLSYYGIFLALVMFFIGLGSKQLHLIEKKIKKGIVYLLLFPGIVFLLLGLTNSIFYLLLIIISAFILGFGSPFVNDHLNKLTKSDIRATVLSVNSMFGGLFFIIIAPIFGKFVDLYSVSFAFICAGILFCIVGIYSIYLLHKNKVI